MGIRRHHQYQVKGIQDLPSTSHLSRVFPECLFTLLRLDTGQSLQVVFRRALGWKVGDTIDLDDLAVQAAAVRK